MGDYGMDILVPGEAPVTADIIFVHGLRGHRLNTWTKGVTVWPRDLLKTKIPHARIMTWGYDAQVANFFEKAGQCSIFDHAQQLLQDISMERMEPEEEARPIFFVAHSLGGVVVKDALSISHMASREDQIYNTSTAGIKTVTQGIVFLGTPHRGSNKAKWATIATNLMGIVLKDHNSKVVDALVSGSETLERIQTNFNKFLITLPVWTCYENLQYEKIGKIVDDDSATLGFPHEQKQWIPANHENMAKFSDEKEVGYKRVSFAITSLVRDGLQKKQAGRSQNGSRKQSKRYISVREHFHDDHKMLNFGCDEFIDNVVQCPGKLWHGKHRGRKGLFLKNSVEEAPEIESALNDEYPDSWKMPPKTLSRSSTFRDSWKPDIKIDIPAFEAHKTQQTQDTTASQIHPIPEHPSPTANEVTKSGSGTDLHEALLVAAEEGTPEAIVRIVKKGVDVNASGGQHGHALCTAASNGRKEIVKVLIEQGAMVNLPANEKTGFALHAAAAEGHVDVVKVLLSKGAEVQLQGGQFRFPLTAAAYSGSMRIIRLLLDHDAELNAKDAENETALHGAVFGGHIEVVQYLLEQGMDPNTKGTENLTPLDMARNTGQRSIEKLLLGEELQTEEEEPAPQSEVAPTSSDLKLDTSTEAESDPVSEELISQYLTIMLVISAAKNDLEDVQTLLEAKVSPNSSWEKHGTALYAACLNGHLETVQLLLEADGDMNGPGGEVGSPFHAACFSGNLVLVILLLAWGADINNLDNETGYPLHVASAAGHIPIMNLLLSMGFPVNAWGGKFGTPLLAAATAGLEASQFLVSRGANVHMRSPAGFGVVDTARTCGHLDAKTFFKRCGAQSSGWTSRAGLLSRLSSLTLKMEKASLEAEGRQFVNQNFATAV